MSPKRETTQRNPGGSRGLEIPAYRSKRDKSVDVSVALDQFALYDDALYRHIDGNVLRKKERPLSRFDEVAGRKMSDAALGENGQYTSAQYAEILADLDRRGLTLKKHLRPKKARKGVAEYNQRHPRIAVTTWVDAFKSRQVFAGLTLRRCVQRTLAKAKEAYLRRKADNAGLS